MLQFFESKDDATMVVVGIIIGAMVLLAIFLFKASFSTYEKYLVVRGKFYSEAVQKVVDNVYPRHDLLKKESLHYFLWGAVFFVIAVILFLFFSF
ncbi:hypothetical protein AADX40_15295 [Aeromonas veronii]|uniref:hypothetical protein n=1 Tax=Aeromonas TaxID=642 RepID=UPI00315850E2